MRHSILVMVWLALAACGSKRSSTNETAFGAPELWLVNLGATKYVTAGESGGTAAFHKVDASWSCSGADCPRLPAVDVCSWCTTPVCKCTSRDCSKMCAWTPLDHLAQVFPGTSPSVWPVSTADAPRPPIAIRTIAGATFVSIGTGDDTVTHLKLGAARVCDAPRCASVAAAVPPLAGATCACTASDAPGCRPVCAALPALPELERVDAEPPP